MVSLSVEQTAFYRVEVPDIKSEPTSGYAAIAAGNLVSGIGLHDPESLLSARPGRLALSSGTQPVSSAAVSGYLDTALVPQAPWRRPSSTEQRLLLASGPPVCIGSHITLVRAPDDVMAHFAPLREHVHSCRSIGELRAWLHRHPYTTGCDAILEFARTYLRSEHPVLEGAAITCRATDLPTATTDDTGAHVGLHIDNWYRSKLAERVNAPNRISINLGVTARFLLYINLPLATIGALAAEQFAFDTQAGDTRNALRQLFMSRCGSYPVVRVRLDPGEGYIAPTENMIHDGCTPAKNALDVQFSVRGRLWPRSSPDY
jgi:hypothetical protein